MSHSHQLATMTLLAWGLGGCTTSLSTQPVPTNGDAINGAPYALPATALDIEVTWRVAKCENVTVQTNDERQPAVNLTLENSGSISKEAIEGELRYIDYTSLFGSTKTGGLKVEYWQVGEGDKARQTRFVKSINGSTQGQESSILTESFKAMGAIARLSLTTQGLPLAAGASEAADPPPPAIACNSSHQANLAAMAAYQVAAKSHADLLEQLNKETARLQGRAILTTPLPGDAKLLRELSDKKKVAEDEFKKKTEVYEKIAATYTYKESYRITEFKGVTASSILSLQPQDPTLRDKWNKDIISTLIDFKPCEGQPSIRAACAARQEKLKSDLLTNLSRQTASLKITSMQTTQLDFSNKEPSSKKGGFVYRSPAIVKLTLNVTGNNKDLVSTEAVIPQLGQPVILAYRNGPGQSNSLVANFSRDGLIQDFDYKVSAVGLSSLMSGTKSAADETNTAVAEDNSRRSARAQAREGAALASIEAELKLVKAQSDLAALQTAPNASLEQRRAELESLKLDIELAKAKRDLEAASKPE